MKFVDKWPIFQCGVCDTQEKKDACTQVRLDPFHEKPDLGFQVIKGEAMSTTCYMDPAEIAKLRDYLTAWLKAVGHEPFSS